MNKSGAEVPATWLPGRNALSVSVIPLRAEAEPCILRCVTTTETGSEELDTTVTIGERVTDYISQDSLPSDGSILYGSSGGAPPLIQSLVLKDAYAEVTPEGGINYTPAFAAFSDADIGGTDVDPIQALIEGVCAAPASQAEGIGTQLERVYPSPILEVKIGRAHV